MYKPDGRVSRRDLLLGSAAAGGLAMLNLPAISFARQAAATSTANPLQGLADMLRGDLITPDQEHYDEARKVWNAMIDKRPAAIARCTGAADVIDVVRYARDNNMAVSVRGGGHNVAGKAVRNGAITIDLGLMHGVWVDPNSKRARVQGGCRWGLVDRETLAHGLYTTGGTVSDTGVGGLTLGGGFGWLMRKHGLACDNVVSANIVTADGHQITASATENPELHWAIRGGGGNFGVVTSFEFQLYDAQPIIGGLALYSRDRFKDMLRFFREYTAGAPDSLAMQCGALVGPPGTPVEGQIAGWIGVCHAGPPDEGARLVQPIKDFAPPAADFIGPTTYTAQQTMFDAGMSIPMQNYWRSNMVKDLSDELIDALDARVDEIPRPGSLLLLEHMEGAVGRVGQHETAFANRGAKYNLSVLGVWPDPADNDNHVAWVRNFGDELRSFATGGAYVNYMADESPERVKAAYEANFQRLVEVKRKYDPTNFWSGNQNIAPSGSES